MCIFFHLANSFLSLVVSELQYEEHLSIGWEFMKVIFQSSSVHVVTWINPPYSKIPPFLEIQDVPTFYRSIGKAKVLNNSCNQFVYNFYPQSILILEECLQKW